MLKTKTDAEIDSIGMLEYLGFRLKMGLKTPILPSLLQKILLFVPFYQDRSKVMRMHPAGFPHGPHPKAFANQCKKTFTDEVAVMVDSQQALQIDPEFAKVELTNYWQSWMKK